MKVRYIGKGAFIAGLPARDLNAEEVKKIGLGKLLESGLYEEIKRKPKAAEKAPEGSNEAEEA